MKLSKTMQEVLDSLINAPFKRLDQRYYHLADRTITGYNGPTIDEDGVITITGHTNTLKALEKRGLIEILVLGGKWSDKVKLLQHTNTSRPLGEMYNLRLVKVYIRGAIDYFRCGDDRECHGKEDGEWVQDGNPEYARRYWDLDEEGRGRGWFATRIEDYETGEILYTWDEEEARRRFMTYEKNFGRLRGEG